MSVAKKTALITGSTSGIGRGVAEALAAGGANIVVNGFGDAAEIGRHCETLASTHLSGTASKASILAVSVPRAFVPGMISKRGSKSTMRPAPVDCDDGCDERERRVGCRVRRRMHAPHRNQRGSTSL